MKIILAGGSGFLGSCLIEKYYDTDIELVVLSRTKEGRDRNVSWIRWDGKRLSDWAKEVEGSTAVINFTGKSVNCRYTDKNKKEIIESRTDAVTVLGKAIGKCLHPPKIWINAGSAAIFGDGGNEVKDEDSLTGNGFSADVCKKWEKAFNEASTPYTRKVYLRIGLVFAKEAWVLRPFINMVRSGLGGQIGNGDQYITWIHKEDFQNLIEWVIENLDVEGTIHASSPFPVTNKEFMKALRRSCNMPWGLPNPAFLVRLGAAVIGTEAELVLTGRRVVSKILKEKQFEFKHPDITLALHDLMNAGKKRNIQFQD